MRKLLAVDIGGTFVDAVTFDPDTGQVRFEKDFTTPADPATGVYGAMGRLDLDVSQLSAFIHGTTLGLNTVLQRSGAKTGIITNEGFEDVFEIARFMRERPLMYSLVYDTPPLLVPRRLRLGVAGRMDARGEELAPLDENGVKECVRRLVEEHGVASIAICFLHAYRNPAHEERAAAIIRTAYPNVSVSVSSEIVREYREYERTATTAVNAYIRPIFGRYIAGLADGMKRSGFKGSFYVTRSGGGSLLAEDAVSIPVETIFSGPAGGIIGAARLSELLNRPNLIAADVGGTSTDACVILDGTPSVSYEARLERLPLMIATYDIVSIGAGGGSIARAENGNLKVGPKSAGSTPGPICYGRGGTEPTLSDAALALGYLSSDNFLGGEMKLLRAEALAGIEAKLAVPLGIDVASAARGVYEILVAKTIAAIRVITVERGLDPRDFSLLVYGGAGAMFMTAVGRELGVGEIIIPQGPSVFSAWGMLMSDVVQTYAQTMIGLIEDVGLDAVHREAESLAEQARRDLKRGGFPPERQTISRSVQLRYFGQEHVLEVPFDMQDGLDDLRGRFDDVHRARYGHAMKDPVQLVNVRVHGIGRNDKPELPTVGPGTGTPPSAGTRRAHCFAVQSETNFAVFMRDALGEGDRIAGPAIIEEKTTTIVLHSDQKAVVDRYGMIYISKKEA